MPYFDLSPAILLHAASLLVPKGRRKDWLAEWMAEVWHIRNSGNGAREKSMGQGEHEVLLLFCLGSFKDAWALRFDGTYSRASRKLQSGAPLRCTIILAAFALISCSLGFLSPEIQEILPSGPMHALDDVALVSREGDFTADQPTISFTDYLSWKDGGAKAFRGLVFYRPASALASLPGLPPQEWRTGFASASLLKLLTRSLIDTNSTEENSERLPVALLSRKIWRENFYADPGIAGRTFLVGKQRVIVGGVAARDSWPIPGRMDILLLEPDAELAASFASSAGYVLAPAIGRALQRETQERPFIFVRLSSGISERFECLTLAQRREDPITLFWLSLLLACLALPATTLLPLGDYPEAHHTLTLKMRVRRWAFLAIKLVFIVPLCFLDPLLLSCTVASPGSTSAVYIQLALSFCLLLASFRWALEDQRRRCPTCLRRLSHPALVGHASRCFLAWSGTEMLCSGGHGFLYIPEHPTSWFSTQRWLSADSSWSGLFQETELANPTWRFQKRHH